MTASKKILLYLGKKKVKFEVVPHKTVFTAYDLAQTLGEKLDKIAKTLLVHVQLPEMKKQGKQTYLVVVPATYYVDLQKVRKSLKATKAELAPEKVMAKFGLKPGALSPFGSLRGLGVFMCLLGGPGALGSGDRRPSAPGSRCPYRSIRTARHPPSPAGLRGTVIRQG